ncbi:hypothetical protein K8R62_00655 [bacterium]|nr:hypothetical protein [bacterium]
MNTPDTLENNINNGAETVSQPESNQDFMKNIIPPQYDGLPSEVVEELWDNSIYIDEEKNKTKIERRQNVINQIKVKENAREEKKRTQLIKKYSQLSGDDKGKFSGAQNDAMKIAHEYIKDERELSGLSKEEEFVFGKIKSAYESFKKENPDKEFPFKLVNDIDRQVWDSFNYRLAFNVLNSQKEISDQDEANKIREEIGVPEQEIKNDVVMKETKDRKEKEVDNTGVDFSKLEAGLNQEWKDGFELAKIAEQQDIDLSSISREDYVQFAIDNKLIIGDGHLRGATWQRKAKTYEEFYIMRKKRKEELNDSKEDKEFAKFEYTIKEIAGKKDSKDRFIKEGVRVKSGTSEAKSWLHFGINDDLEEKNKETYKAYISLKDIRKLSPDRIVSLMEKLQKFGYNGQVKTFQALADQGVLLNDQVVMHGKTEEDANLALQIAKDYFGDELNQKSLGKDEVIDGKNKSYSEILADRIKDEIKNSLK